MSGYKRVNFYELCRLCATNQQKEKTHIFEEEGRKMQLQNKIQKCLSLTVCENDFLPKVVCAKCLRCIEVCFSFRQESVASESMLSSYFKNFRYTEDFKRSGKVYIKDTPVKSTPPPPPPPPPQQPEQPPQISAPTSVINAPSNTYESLPFYTLQIPAIVTTTGSPQQAQPAEAKNLLSLGLKTAAVAPKMVNEGLGNVFVHSGGEMVQILDCDIVNSAQQTAAAAVSATPPRPKKKSSPKEPKLLEIELRCEDFDVARKFKAPQCGVKVDHKFNNNNNNSNNNNNVQPQQMSFVGNVQYPTTASTGGSQATTTTPSIVTTSNLQQPPSLMCDSPNQASTVNLNVLQQDLSFNLNFPRQTKEGAGAGNMATSSAAPSVTSSPTTKQHMCEICQKSFKRREHLYQHVKLHTGFRPYTCDNCQRSFMRKEHLMRHMTSHSGQKNYTCDVCDKSFSRNDNLLKHKKTHEKQSTFLCEICQKQFVMKHYFLAHKKTHEGGGGGELLVAAPRLGAVWSGALKAS